MNERTYIAIDLKSFYASVECVERQLDPLNTNLVVADESRTEKTIVLAVSPSLKAFGLPGRPRLFEVIQQVEKVNNGRLYQYRKANRDFKLNFSGKSHFGDELKNKPSLAVDYIVAPPRMKYYIEYSTKIYEVYLKYISEEDIVVYSIDEVFMDVTNYLEMYKQTAHELAMTIIRDVLKTTGITATAGIGTNLYLAKIAMDIVAKKMPPDKDGVRIAELDEISYRRQLWEHTPLTDFWRLGAGYAKKLQANGMYTMGDIAERSEYDEEIFYKLFGVNAELLIDHAWGYEPCTVPDIKSYKPQSNSISQGQVLSTAYDVQRGKIVTLEMADMLALDLVFKGLVTDQIVLTIGYDHECGDYTGEFTVDRYGRKIPKHAHGTEHLPRQTSSAKLIYKATSELFDRIINPKLKIRRINIVACNVIPESKAHSGAEQLDLFTDAAELERLDRDLEREKNMQKAIITLKEKFGKNAVLKGMNLEEGATAKDRNRQIGGHKA